MKIVILRVCGAFGGGIFKTVGRLMNDLDHDLFEQHLVFQTRTSELTEDWLRGIHPAIKLHPWKCTRTIDPMRDAGALLQLHRLIRAIRPDVIHAHSSKAGLVRALAPFHRRTPIIYTPHGFGFLQENLSTPKRLLIRSVERLLAACGGEIVGVSPSEGRLAATLSRRAGYIRNPCDVNEIRAVVGGPTSPGGLRIGMSGRANPQKNFPMFAAVARRLPETTFHWIGAVSPTDLDNDLPDNVRITGWLPWEDCIRAIGRLGVYIHTSLWEGVSNTLLEAMALRKPAIVYPCGGNRDAVQHGRTGFYAETPEQFADYIRLIAEVPALGAYLGANAEEYVAREFGPERFVAEWAHLYLDRACAGAARPRAA